MSLSIWPPKPLYLNTLWHSILPRWPPGIEARLFSFKKYLRQSFMLCGALNYFVLNNQGLFGWDALPETTSIGGCFGHLLKSSEEIAKRRVGSLIQIWNQFPRVWCHILTIWEGTSLLRTLKKAIRQWLYYWDHTLSPPRWMEQPAALMLCK